MRADLARPVSLLPLIALGAALLLPARAAAIDAIFADGFDDRACAWSGAASPPEPCGPGHLVLIGHDYAPVVVPRGGSADAAAALTGIEQVLVNAVAQSHATGLPRATRLAILDENAASDELAHVSAVLAGAFTLVTEVVAVAGVPAALGHSDVLLIPDQNGYFADDPAQIAAAELAPSLRAFLETGGVVIVLDGTYVQNASTVPSKTYRVLDPRLLGIDAATTFQGCVQVPCNDADPLLAGAASQSCSLQHTVSFLTDEPWFTLAYREPGQPDQAFVLHRWFGTAQSGPIAYDIDSANADLSGYSVFFQDAAGQPVGQCLTLTNGSAVHQMGPDGFVSLGVNSGSRQLVTVIGAQPLDHLEQRSQLQPEGTIFEVTASLPGTVEGANTYRVMLGCDSAISGNQSIVVATTTACANPDGSFSVVGEALDQAGRILAYTIVNGVTDATAQPVALPAWKAPDLLAFTTGVTPSGIQQIALDVRLSASGGADYLEGGAAVLRNGNGGTFPFYSDPGLGQPGFTQLTHHGRLRFFNGGQAYTVASERTERGPLLDSLPLDLGDFLPRITDSSVGFDANQRLRLDWTLAAAAPGVDGGVALASWNRDFVFYQWVIVFPPGTTLTAPPNPGGDGDMFWPSAETDLVTLNQLRLDDPTFLPSYRDYRQRVLGVLQPPAGPYVLRSTELLPPF